MMHSADISGHGTGSQAALPFMLAQGFVCGSASPYRIEQSAKRVPQSVLDASALAWWPEKITLTDPNATVPKDGVGRRDMEIEVRQCEVDQIGLSLEGVGFPSNGNRDVSVFRAINLSRLQGF
jgi:hypothetical protein